MGPALYLMVVIVWGGTWIAIKYQVEGGPLTASICYRMAGGAAILFLIMLAMRVRLRFRFREHLLMAGTGLCMFSTNYIFLYWSERYIASGMVALIFALTLPMNVANSAIFRRKPLDRSIAVACVLGVIGCATVFWNDIADFTWSSHSLRGVISALLATYCFSMGNVISDTAQERGIPILQTEAYGLTYGALIMVPVTLASGGFGFALTPKYIGSLAYLIILGSIVAFGAYMWIIGRIGAGRAAYVTVLFPMVALLLSTFLEGYVWTPRALAGATLILAGSAIAVTGRRSAGPAPAEVPVPVPPAVPGADSADPTKET